MASPLDNLSAQERRRLLAQIGGGPAMAPLGASPVQNMPYFPGVSDQGLSVINGPYVPGAPSNLPLQIPMGAPLAPGVPVPPEQQLVIGPDGVVTYPSATPVPAAGSGRQGFMPIPTVEATPLLEAPAAPGGLSPQDAASFSFFLGQDTAAQPPPAAAGPSFEDFLAMDTASRNLPNQFVGLARPESRVGRDLLTSAPAPVAGAAPAPSPVPSREAPKGNKFSNAPRTPVPAGQQLIIDDQGNVTYPNQQGAPTPSNVPTPTAAPAPATPMPGVLQRPTNAYTVGAPGADDMTDRFGRFTPGAQSFAKTAFAAADNARKLLEDYKKANPNDKAGIAAREAASNQAATRASQANAWMAMPTSTRQRLLTEGQVEADRATAIEQGRQRINEMRQDPNLMQVLNDFNQTGVLRGGAGPGTATIPSSGAMISAPDAKGTRTLTSPYGTGSSTMMTPNQFANRPEAMIDGKPASQFFEDASLRQGRDITVGGVQYSGAGTNLAPGRASYTPYDQKQVEGRRAFWEEEAKRNREKGTAPIR